MGSREGGGGRRCKRGGEASERVTTCEVGDLFRGQTELFHHELEHFAGPADAPVGAEACVVLHVSRLGSKV